MCGRAARAMHNEQVLQLAHLTLEQQSDDEEGGVEESEGSEDDNDEDDSTFNGTGGSARKKDDDHARGVNDTSIHKDTHQDKGSDTHENKGSEKAMLLSKTASFKASVKGLKAFPALTIRTDNIGGLGLGNGNNTTNNTTNPFALSHCDSNPFPNLCQRPCPCPYPYP